jgi:negative regulator of flagellin synthesis FlgM
MRIDPLNSAAASQVTTEPNSAHAAAQSAAHSAQAGTEDRTTLTSDTASVNSLVSLALNSPAIRQDKVDSLRESVNNGTYEVDPSKIASSMLDEYA